MSFGVLLLLHAVAMAGAMLVGARSIRGGLLAAATAPAVTAIWAITHFGSTDAPRASLTWVDGLDIAFEFELDPFAALMTALVSGIGALVFVYASGYFSSGTKGARFPATLLGFSVSMLGLVWADSIWTLFIFWEFTSISSFLLVGYKNTNPAVQASARRALFLLSLIHI